MNVLICGWGNCRLTDWRGMACGAERELLGLVLVPRMYSRELRVAMSELGVCGVGHVLY